MKALEATIYKCDHCGKNYLRQKACQNHEAYCSKKWACQPQCFQCKFFQRWKETVQGRDTQYLSNRYGCEKMGVLLYPEKAVRKGLLEKNPELFVDAIQIPRSCPLFKSDKAVEHLF